MSPQEIARAAFIDGSRRQWIDTYGQTAPLMRDTREGWERLADQYAETAVPAGDFAPGQQAWRCFHCDEVFTEEAAAELHFGRELRGLGVRVEFDPACRIKQGAEMSLLVALRRLEEEMEVLRHQLAGESTEADQLYHAQQHRHRIQMEAAEILGYERGLRGGAET